MYTVSLIYLERGLHLENRLLSLSLSLSPFNCVLHDKTELWIGHLLENISHDTQIPTFCHPSVMNISLIK